MVCMIVITILDIYQRTILNPDINTRSNSKVRPTNCHVRNMSVIRQQANLKRWKRRVNYGYRWMAETAFSSIKRMFGEHVTARKFPNMIKEIFLRQLCITCSIK